MIGSAGLYLKWWISRILGTVILLFNKTLMMVWFMEFGFVYFFSKNLNSLITQAQIGSSNFSQLKIETLTGFYIFTSAGFYTKLRIIDHFNFHLNFLPAYSRKTKLGCESKERKRLYFISTLQIKQTFCASS